MSVSLVEVMAAAAQRLAPLSGECAGHAVLAAVDQLLTNPRVLGPADVLIEENGAVRLAHGQATDARGCDEAMRSLLDSLLAVAHSGGVGLLRVGRRGATGNLAQLVKELEVALIPANRAAARRSLARLCRETCRARDAGGLSALPPPVLERPAPSSRMSEPARPKPAAPESAGPDPGVPEPPVAEPVPLGAALGEAEAAGPREARSEATGEPLAFTEMRWATAPGRVSPPPDPVEVDIDFAAITPVIAGRTQPLPKVAPRPGLHETMSLPPVSRRPVLAEHETPLEPVLSRRHAGPPRPQREFADIHQTPYFGTQVSTVPVYDARAREAWQVPTPAPANAVAEWDIDEATTDPAPVVAWSAPDEDGELLEVAPLPGCPALAVEPRVPPLAEESGTSRLASKEPSVFRPSDVEELVERFSIAEPDPDPQLSRSLKQLAGITATPPPVLARADAAPGHPPRKPPESSEPGLPGQVKPSSRVAGS